MPYVPDPAGSLIRVQPSAVHIYRATLGDVENVSVTIIMLWSPAASPLTTDAKAT